MKTLLAVAILILCCSTVARADTISTWDFSGSADGYTFSGSLTADYAPQSNAAPYDWISAIDGGTINGQAIAPQSFTIPQGGQFCDDGVFSDCEGSAFTFLAGGTTYRLWWNDSGGPNSGMDFDGYVVSHWSFADPVAEPSAALLLLVGLACVAGMWKRKGAAIR